MKLINLFPDKLVIWDGNAITVATAERLIETLRQRSISAAQISDYHAGKADQWADTSRVAEQQYVQLQDMVREAEETRRSA